MKRREFIAALGAAALARPYVLRAQQAPRTPRIGRLSSGTSQLFEDTFREGLRDFGYFEGQNLLVDYRRADETPGQLDGFAAELIALNVDIIVTGNSQATRAAFNRTKTIPIVTMSTNPVGPWICCQSRQARRQCHRR